MNINIVPEELIDLFTDSVGQSTGEVLQQNWQSIACMFCGACCFSSVVPISQGDFDSFYDRLGLKMDREIFGREFLAEGGPNALNHTIATEKFGGRCMFLGWRGYFGCDVWKQRPFVCREYLCFEMTNFEKWLNAEEQVTFNQGAGPQDDDTWLDNFRLLLEKLKSESPLSFFPKEQMRHALVCSQGLAPSHFELNSSKYDGSQSG